MKFLSDEDESVILFKKINMRKIFDSSSTLFSGTTFSSFLSSFIVSAIGTPWDVIKNYWISSKELSNVRTKIGMIHVIKSLYKLGGIKAFYTGYIASCCTIIPSNIIFFFTYERFLNFATPLFAGIGARVVAVICTSPFEYVRTRMQANATTDIRKVLALKDIVFFHKGLFVTLLRDVPFSAIYWSLNEPLKSLLIQYDPYYNTKNQTKKKFIYPFISGACAAAIACTSTHPLDVIKTNIQNNSYSNSHNSKLAKGYRTTLLIGKKIYSTNGIRGLYVGLLPRLGKIIPSCAFLLGSYDLSKYIFQ